MDIDKDPPAGSPPETADVESSSEAYAARFSGKTGEWMLRVQESIALEMLGDLPGASVLDVGGGHGQLAIPLAEGGWNVTVLGSTPECGARIARAVESGMCRFETGNILALPFPDLSFDVAVSFRLLSHCRRWDLLIGELCRVARRAVIIDYPTSQSLNRIAPLFFGAKKKMEGNTREWTLFRHAEVEKEFAARGFTLLHRRPQFFLPMVLHRILRTRPLSAATESLFRLTGFTGRWGSPVILKATRGGASP
jgi:2-polyprenyl-3-methyl-5-hydroxy-6-metoxy-1,4-benzoquinol methylase